jgi:hypothetical protein
MLVTFRKQLPREKEDKCIWTLECKFIHTTNNASLKIIGTFMPLKQKPLYTSFCYFWFCQKTFPKWVFHSLS